MSTLTAIAQQAGVSVRTVSVALNGDPKRGRIAAARVQHIRKIADELGYRPHAGARAMRGQRFRQIGLVFRVDAVSRLAHALILEMLLGINSVLQDHDYVVSLIPTVDLSGPDDLSSRALREHAVDNLIVVDSIAGPLRGWIEKTFPRAIWANADVWNPHNCVRRDEISAGRVAAEQMVRLGYRELVYVERAASADYEFAPHYSFVDRRRGVELAASEAGVAFRSVGLPMGSTHRNDRDKIMSDILRQGTAVVVGDIYLARALQQTFSNLNRRPGYDFAVCCCDDADELGEVWDDLARVRFERFVLGRAAGEMALSAVAESDEPQASVTFCGTWKPGPTARPFVRATAS